MKGLIKQLLLWGVGGVLLALIILQLAGAFDEKIEPGPAAAPRGPRIEGAAVAVAVVDEPVVERYPGTVAAVREVSVSARLIARVQEILVRPGQRVERGEALVALDGRELETRYAQTKESLVGAEARLREAKANYERMRDVQEGAVSKAQLDRAQAGFESAKSEVESMQQRLEEAKVALSYATIEAPFDAVVVDRYAEPGDLASPGRPLLRLYDPSAMRLEGWVRETIAFRLKPGDELTVRLDAADEELAGKVEEIVPQAEAGSRSFLVKVALPARENLYPGMFGRLLLPAGTVRRALIPAAAVAHVGQLAFVVLDDAAQTKRLIELGAPRDDGKVEVLSGLREGERVLIPKTRP